MELTTGPQYREEKILQFSGAYQSGTFTLTLKEDTDQFEPEVEAFGQHYIRVTMRLPSGVDDVIMHNKAHLHFYSLIHTVQRYRVKPEDAVTSAE